MKKRKWTIFFIVKRVKGLYMDKYKITGPIELKGTVSISGSKNATLPIITASLLAKGKFTLKNVPNLRDIRTILQVVEGLGVQYSFNNNILELDTTNFKKYKAPYELVKTMRASIYVLGPLLAILKKAEVSLPGGCAIGPRPIDIHLKSFEKLGAQFSIKNGFVIGKASQLKGTEIFMEKVSVGATANLLMGAVLAKGTTKLFNAAMEPEITDLIHFLNKMGAKIKGENTNILTIKGVSSLKPITYKIIPDRIEAGTFIMGAAITKSSFTIKNINNEHLKNIYDILDKIGIKYTLKGATAVTIHKTNKLIPLDITTAPYPGYPTDMQPQLVVLLSLVKGKSVINETIFENRFMHVSELNRMGANIQYDEHLAIIEGVKNLTGAPVMASDLRAGAALVLAGMSASGVTIVHRIYHIDRGYENFENKLTKLGAKIERIKEVRQ